MNIILTILFLIVLATVVVRAAMYLFVAAAWGTLALLLFLAFLVIVDGCQQIMRLAAN